jgi:predicted aldo/keto reductase-like oxidoreductase
MLNEKHPIEAAKLVANAFEAGINYFDVAPGYGQAQFKIGPALAPFRKDVTLTCKSHEKTAERVTAELEESLRGCQTDHFDLYQLHACDEQLDTVLGPGGALEAIVKAKEQGKVLRIGFSCHRERSALYLMSQFSFDTFMHPINWSNNIHNGKGDLALKVAAQQNMGILGLKALALRPLGPGEPKRFPNCWYMPITENEALAELALRFTLSRVHVAVSPGSEEMLALMLRLIDKPGMGEPLTAEQMQVLEREAAPLQPLFPD